MNVIMEVLSKRSTIGAAIGAVLFNASLVHLQEYINIRDYGGLVLAIDGFLCCIPGLDVIAKNIAAGGRAPTKAAEKEKQDLERQLTQERHRLELDMIRAKAMANPTEAA